ncbi:hypothetical protein GCM10023322_08400 [Rugosimonospora acidiphila]|uniref:Virulence plasmid A protein n=1 Tax=Rugosimonospora acidiphila TaxID=556531 RepID=A0ABP9RJU7_9ACTN
MARRGADERERQAHRTPADATVRYLPRRVAARLGLGAGLVLKVRETGRAANAAPPAPARGEITDAQARRIGIPGGGGAAMELPTRQPAAAPAPPPPTPGRALWRNGLAAAEAAIPGLTRPGSRTYSATALEAIAELSAGDALNAGMLRYFGSGLRTGPVRLASRRFTTTRDGGQVNGRVELIARPAPGFDTFDDARRLFGRVADGGGVETHGVAGRSVSKGKGSSVTKSGTGGVSVLSPGQPASTRWHNPSAAGRVSGQASRSESDDRRADDRHTSRDYATMIDFGVPVELALRVVPAPASGVNAIGPAVAEAVRGQSALAPQWVDSIAEVRVPASDTSPEPIRVAPPAWLTPPQSSAQDPREPGLVLGEYTAPPANERMSFLNGLVELTALAKQVLPDVIRKDGGAERIEDYVSGMTGEVGVHRFLAPGGAEHDFPTGIATDAWEHMSTLAIEPVAAGPWEQSYDYTENNPSQAYPVGEGAQTILEHAPVFGHSARSGAGASRTATANASLGVNLWAKQNQVDKSVPNAPGNYTTAQVNYFNPSSTGGEPVQSGSGGSTGGYRLTRAPGLHREAGDTTPNVLAHRTVLFRVRGAAKARIRGTDGWRAEPTNTRWLVAVVEDNVPRSVLAPVPAPLPAIPPPPQIFMVRNVLTTGPTLDELMPRTPATVPSFVSGLERRYGWWADDHLRQLSRLAADALAADPNGARTELDAKLVLDRLQAFVAALNGMKRVARLAQAGQAPADWYGQIRDTLRSYDFFQRTAAELAETDQGVAALVPPPVNAIALAPPAYPRPERPETVTWLLDQGLTRAAAERIAGDPGYAFDHAAAHALAGMLGLDAAGRRQLIGLSEVLRRVPNDLPGIAAEMGLAEPDPLWAVVRDLGVDPRSVRAVLGDVLVDAVGPEATADPAGPPWVDRLVTRLAEAGVRSRTDLTHLIDLSARLGLDPADRAALGEMRGQGVSLELLAELPDDLVRAALRASTERSLLDLDTLAQRLGLADAGAVHAAAVRLGLTPSELDFLLRELPGLEGEPVAGRSGEAFGDLIEQRLMAHGFSGPEYVQWVRWSARLGFGVQNLVALLPGHALDPYVYELLDDVRAGRAGSAVAEMVPATGPGGELAESVRDLIAANGHTPGELRSWSDSMRVDPAALKQVLDLPMVHPRTFVAALQTLAPTPEAARQVIDLVRATGRVPSDLMRSAYRLGLDLSQAAGLSAGLRTDPRHLLPWKPVLDRYRDIVPAGQASAAELREMIGGFVADPRGDALGWPLWLGAAGAEGFAPDEMTYLRRELSRRDPAIRALIENRGLAIAAADTVARTARQAGGRGALLTSLDRLAGAASHLATHLTTDPGLPAAHAVSAALSIAERSSVALPHAEALRAERDRLVRSAPMSTYDAVQLVRMSTMLAQETLTSLAAADGASEEFRRIAGTLTGQLERMWLALAAAGEQIAPAQDGPRRADLARYPALAGDEGIPRYAPPPGRQDDLVLASLWSRRLGIPVEYIEQTLRSSASIDHRDIAAHAQSLNMPAGELIYFARSSDSTYPAFLRLAVAERMSAATVSVLRALSQRLGVSEYLLVRAVPALLDSGTRGIGELEQHLTTELERLNGLLPGMRTRLTFMADTGLTLADLPELPRMTSALRRWQAGSFGLDERPFVNAQDRDWYSVTEWDQVLNLLLTDLERRDSTGQWSTDALDRLSAALGISWWWIRGHSLRLGRVPTDLPDLARRWSVVDPGRIFLVAAELGVDPRDLAGRLSGDLVKTLNGIPDRNAAARQVADELRATGELPTPTRSLTLDLFELARSAERVPTDLGELADRAWMSVRELIETARLAGADPRLIVAFVESTPADPAATPRIVADGYGAWAERLGTLGVDPADIWSMHTQLRSTGRPLGSLLRMPADAGRVAVENLRTAVDPRRFNGRFQEIVAAHGTGPGLLDAITEFAAGIREVGGSVTPFVLGPPAPAGLSVTLPLFPAAERELRPAIQGRPEIRLVESSRGLSVTMDLGQNAWRTLAFVDRHSGGFVAGDARISGLDLPGPVTAVDFAQLTPGGIQALLGALAMPLGQREHALAALRRELNGNRVVVAARPPALDAAQFDAFADPAARAQAMLVAIAAGAVADQWRPPPGWRAYELPDAPGNGVARAVLDSATRQNVPLPFGVRDAASLFEYTALQVRNHPERLPALSGYTAGRLFSWLLDDATVVALVTPDGAEGPRRSPASARPELARLIDAGDSHVQSRIGEHFAADRSPLAPIATQIAAAVVDRTRLTAADVFTVALTDDQLRGHLPAATVEQALGAALGVNLVVVPDSGASLGHAVPDATTTLIIGRRDGYRAYGPPEGAPVPPGADVQVFMMRAAEVSGPRFAAEAARPIEDLRNTVAGITHDYEVGYGARLRPLLTGRSRELFDEVGAALALMRQTLSAPGVAEPVAQGQFHDLLLLIDQAHAEDVRMPDVPDLVNAWSTVPSYAELDPRLTTWLAGRGITGSLASRLAADTVLAFDPVRADRMALWLGLDDQGVRQLAGLTVVLGGLPDDVVTVAEQLGVNPGPLYAVVRDLAVPPADLAVVAGPLRAVLAGATEVDPVGLSWTDRLREHLGSAGVRTDDDLVTLVDLTGRLGLDAADHVVLGRLTARGVTLGLLNELPDDLVRAALTASAARAEFDASAYARSLRLAGPHAVQAAADVFGVVPADLAWLTTAYPRVLDGSMPVPPPSGMTGDPLKVHADIQGIQLAEVIRNNLAAGGLAPEHQGHWIRWGARLGFGVHNLRDLLPQSRWAAGYLSRLTATALHEVPPDLVRMMLQRALPRTGPYGDAEQSVLDRAWRSTLQPTELDELAADLGVDPGSLQPFATLPSVDARSLLPLVRSTRLTPEQTGRLVELAAYTGHLPSTRDLLRLAQQTGWEPGDLVDLASALDVDPSYLRPLNGVLRRVTAMPENIRPSTAQVVAAIRAYLNLDDERITPEVWLWAAGLGTGADGLTLAELQFLRDGAAGLNGADLDYKIQQLTATNGAITAVTAAVRAARQFLPERGADDLRALMEDVLGVARQVTGVAVNNPMETRQTFARDVANSALRVAEKAGITDRAEALRGRLEMLDAAGAGPMIGRAFALAIEATQLAGEGVLTAMDGTGRVGQLHAREIAYQFQQLGGSLARVLAAEYQLHDASVAEWERFREERFDPDVAGEFFVAPAGNQADLLLADWWAKKFEVDSNELRSQIERSAALDLVRIAAVAEALGIAPAGLIDEVMYDGGWLDGIEDAIGRATQHAAEGVFDAGLLATVHAVASKLDIRPAVLLRLLGPLWAREDDEAVAIHGDGDKLTRHVREGLSRLDGVLAGDLATRAAFLLDRDLSLEDAEDLERIRPLAEIWRADTFGLDPTEAVTVRGQQWFSDDDWDGVLREAWSYAASREPFEHWDAESLRTLVAALGVSEQWVRGFALRIGRMPTDLPRLAGQWGIEDPGRLFLLAAALSTDPQDFERVWTDTADELRTRLRSLNAGPDRHAAASRVAAELREAGWQPRPRESLPAALLTATREHLGVPADLVRRAIVLGAPLDDLLTAGRLAHADPRAIAAYIGSTGYAETATAGPGRLATGFQDWTAGLEERFGIAPAEIWQLYDSARASNDTLGTLDDQPGRAAQLLGDWRAAAFDQEYLRRFEQIVRRHREAADDAAMRAEIDAFVARLARVGRTLPPRLPELSRPAPIALSFHVARGQATVASAMVDRSNVSVAEDRVTVRLPKGSSGWQTLTDVLSVVSDPGVRTSDFTLITATAHLEVDDLPQLHPTEVQLLVAAVALDLKHRYPALAGLGWTSDIPVLSRDDPDATGSLFTRDVPDRVDFSGFEDIDTRAAAMLVSSVTRRRLARTAPSSDGEGSVSHVSDVSSVTVRADAEPATGTAAGTDTDTDTDSVFSEDSQASVPETWRTHGTDAAKDADGLFRVVMDSVGRQRHLPPEGVYDGPSLLAHVADQVAAGTVELPMLADLTAGKLVVSQMDGAVLDDMILAIENQRGSTMTDLARLLDTGDPLVLRYLDHAYADDTEARVAPLARKVARAAADGSPLTAGQVFAEILRDPIMRSELPSALAEQAVAYTLGVDLISVYPDGDTETQAGPDDADELFIGESDDGYRAYGPPAVVIDPDSLKAGQRAWRFGHLTVIGSVESWAGDAKTLRAVLEASRPIVAGPVLVIRGPALGSLGPGMRLNDSRAADPARESAELTTLGTLLRRYAQAGEVPTVVSTGEAPALTELLDRQRVPSVIRVPTFLGESWQPVGADGVPLAKPVALDADVFELPAGLDRPEGLAPPAALAEWLDQPDWLAAEQHLAAQLSTLLDPAIGAALDRQVAADPDNRELAAAQVLLQLARAAGGLGTAEQQALEPETSDAGIGAGPLERPAPAGPLSPVVARKYLETKASVEDRRGWNDQLFGLLYEGKLTGAQAVALAKGLVAPDGGVERGLDRNLINAKVVQATAMVLGMTLDEAAEGPNEGNTYQNALWLVTQCAITPNERWLAVLRLSGLRERLAAEGLPGRFAADRATDHAEALRLLTETLSNC